jgi:hypothetical protein
MDKDSGDMVFRMKMPNCGIILLRSAHSGPTIKIFLLKKVLSLPESDLSGRFVVVTENAIRISGTD